MKGFSVYSGFSQGYTGLPVSTRAAVRRQNTEHPRQLHHPYAPTLWSVLTRKHITKVGLLPETSLSLQNITGRQYLSLCMGIDSISCLKHSRNTFPVLNINELTSFNGHGEEAVKPKEQSK